MSTSRRTTGPGAWDDARDGQFFRITAALFSPQFCLGATVLLASYDDEASAMPPVPVTASPLALVPRPAPIGVRRGTAA